MTHEQMKGGVSAEMKICGKCGESKPQWCFKPRCKNCDECNSKHRKRPNHDARARAAWAYGLRKLGLEPEDYDRMFEEQDGKCAICRKPEVSGKRLAVDHDHETNRVRGLLCRNCNVALGLLKDDVERLQNAVCYLAVAIS